MRTSPRQSARSMAPWRLAALNGLDKDSIPGTRQPYTPIIAGPASRAKALPRYWVRHGKVRAGNSLTLKGHGRHPTLQGHRPTIHGRVPVRAIYGLVPAMRLQPQAVSSPTTVRHTPVQRSILRTLLIATMLMMLVRDVGRVHRGMCA